MENSVVTNPKRAPVYIVLISIHGLIRGTELELGRDADTGGQVKYVVELARALGAHPEVEKVLLLTRKIIDPAVSSDYAACEESISEKVSIVRIECGEQKYLRKELLWDSLENFADNAFAYLKRSGRTPDIIHGHYADAGYVGVRLSHQLGVPLVFTGHSLGRNKLNQLLAHGIKRPEMEASYSISRRIEAEETTLSVASRIITSTQQEIEHQYGLYDFYQPELMQVIPPGTDLKHFFPPTGKEMQEPIVASLDRFLTEPQKPMILAIARPDPKKNLVSLIKAYGQSAELVKAANLVLVAGNRDDIHQMEEVTKQSIQDILITIDQYDLYGHVAYPKHHRSQDIPALYRCAAASRGVFVNPALTEPFGLTLIEAAASGLPVVATEDGGPRDIIRNCQHGHLVNPLDIDALTDSLKRVLKNAKEWDRLSKNGIQKVPLHYSWQSHVEKYLAEIRPLILQTPPIHRQISAPRGIVFRDRAIFASLDLNLVGDASSLHALLERIKEHRKWLVFGIATGRRLENALATLRQHEIPAPDVLITGQGTAIHYTSSLTKDDAWQRHISFAWDGEAVRKVLHDTPGILPQPAAEQSIYQISYFIDTSIISPQEVRTLLQRNELAVNVVISFGQFLDITPVRASKGLALRWCSEHLEIPLENTLVAGVTGADADMLLGNTLGTVVDSFHREELSTLAGTENVFFSRAAHAGGIIEAMDHYGFPEMKR